MTEPAFRPAEPPSYQVPDTLSADLVIFPREVDDEGIGLYEGALTDAVKQLRMEGVNAAYLHEADERDWIGEKSFTPNELNLVIAVAGAVIGAAVWDSIKKLFSLLRGGGDRPLKLKVGSYSTRPDGTVTQDWFEVEGMSDDVERILDRFPTPEIEQ